MYSKSFRSLDGHLDKREKLLVKIGWSQLNACCLILLWEGLERGLFVRKDIPLCSQILLMRCLLVSPILYGLALSTWIFINNIWWHHKRDLILKGEKWTYCTFIIEQTAKLNLRVKFLYNVIQIFRKFNT